MSDLNHQRVLVTGAAQGLGRAIAERFLEQGATVLLTDSVEDHVINTVTDNLERRFPGLAFGKRLEVTDERQAIEGFPFMRDVLGGCDVLVNNAGINHECPSESFRAGDSANVSAVNLR